MNPNIIRAFEILETLPNATREEVKAAYNLMAQVWHPDKHIHNDKLYAKATSKFKEINSALSVIEEYFNDCSASEYDKQRKADEEERYRNNVNHTKTKDGNSLSNVQNVTYREDNIFKRSEAPTSKADISGISATPLSVVFIGLLVSQFIIIAKPYGAIGAIIAAIIGYYLGKYLAKSITIFINKSNITHAYKVSLGWLSAFIIFIVVALLSFVINKQSNTNILYSDMSNKSMSTIGKDNTTTNIGSSDNNTATNNALSPVSSKDINAQSSSSIASTNNSGIISPITNHSWTKVQYYNIDTNNIEYTTSSNRTYYRMAYDLVYKYEIDCNAKKERRVNSYFRSIDGEIRSSVIIKPWNEADLADNEVLKLVCK